MGSLLKNVKMYYVYDQYDNVTQYLRTQLDKMCKDIGITKSGLQSMISRHEHLRNHTIYKLTQNERTSKII